MTKEKQLQFFKEYFEFEEKRKNDINSQLAFLLSNVVLLTSFVAFYALNFPETFENICLTISFTISILSGLFFIISAVYEIYSMVLKYKYRYIASPNDINDYMNASDVTDEKFDEYLRDDYRESADHNQKINDKKFYHMTNIKKFVIYGLVSLTIAFIPYYFLMGDQLNSYKVEISNQKENKPMADSNEINATHADTNQSQTASTEALVAVQQVSAEEVKPQTPRPAPRYVQEGIDPSKIVTKEINETKPGE